MESTIRPTPSPERRVDNPDVRDFSVWTYLLRAIPLTISFLLFILAVSVDVNKWGSRLIQVFIAIAIILGAIGIALFLPKRV